VNASRQWSVIAVVGVVSLVAALVVGWRWMDPDRAGGRPIGWTKTEVKRTIRIDDTPAPVVVAAVDELRIRVEADGGFTVDGRAVTVGELDTLLALSFSQRVVIESHPDADYGTLVGLMAQVKEAGIGDVRVDVR
jgi:hypothetical protein